MPIMQRVLYRVLQRGGLTGAMIRIPQVAGRLLCIKSVSEEPTLPVLSLSATSVALVAFICLLR